MGAKRFDIERLRRGFAVLALALAILMPAGAAFAQDADGGADTEFEQNWAQQTVVKTQIELAKALIVDNELALPIMRAMGALTVAQLQQKLAQLQQREQTLIGQAQVQFLLTWLRTNPAGFRYAMTSVVNMMMFGLLTNLAWSNPDPFAVQTLYSFYALAYLNYGQAVFTRWYNLNKFLILKAMGINPEVDRAGNVQAGPLTPAQVFAGLRSRGYDTVTLVQDGQTVVLGGLQVLDENESKRRVPYLSDIPGLGHLFKNGGMMPRDRNLMIFVTPQVIRQAE